jgi:filamentous hemagglutinin family protein
MTKCIGDRLWWQIGITLAATSGALFCWNDVAAQVVLDRTMGAESSIVTPNVEIKGLPSDRIDGGAIRGADLFHSFQEFNVREGRGVYFSNPIGIENILTRVTGKNASNIFGRLGVLGNANLFLLNPNGIIFGPNASLDIAGSFMGSTANSLNFADGTEFSATNPTALPLLIMKVPLGVQFPKEQPKAIVNTGNLSAGTGQNLTLLGGTVVSTGQLSAPFGQISVAAVPGGSVVKLSPTAQLLNIDIPSPEAGVSSLENTSPSSASLTELLTNNNETAYPGLTVNSNGVELEGSSLPVVDGDVVARNVTAETAILSANHNLTLVESQLSTMGDLNLLAGDTVRVRDSVANPFVAQAGGQLLVQGKQGVDIFALNHPSSGLVSGKDMVLRSANTVGGDAHYWSGGSFRIEKLDGSLGGLFSPYDPIIRSRGDVSFQSYTGGSLHIFAGGSVTIPGTVTITGADGTNGLVQRVFLSDDAPDGDRSFVDIDGRNSPTLDIRSGTTAFNSVGNIPNPVPGIVNLSVVTQPTSANIEIGRILIQQGEGQVFLTNQYQPNLGLSQASIKIGDSTQNSQLFSINALGDLVTIDARGDVEIYQGIITGIRTGIGGDINILSGRNINIGEGIGEGENPVRGSLSSLANNGSGGDITLTANGNIRSGSIEASSNSNDEFSTITLKSSAGSVFLGSIFLKEANLSTTSTNDIIKLSTTNKGSNYAGDIIIEAGTNANNNVEITGSNIQTDGYFGTITIQAGGKVSITKSTVTAQTQEGLPVTAEGISPQAGNIEITSQNGNIDINNSRITSSTSLRLDDKNINAGNITIDAKNGSVSIGSPSVSNTDGSRVLSRNEGGRGDAGNVRIQAQNGKVTIAGVLRNDDATVGTDVAGNGVGNGGNTTISARLVEIKDEAIVAASIIYGSGRQEDRGVAKAGNVDITATDTVSVNNSVVFSEIGSSSVGNGGEVKVTAPNVTLDNGASLITIVREGGQGKGGDITIRTDSLSLKNGSLLATSTSGNSNFGVQGGAGNVTIKPINSESDNTVSVDGQSDRIGSDTSGNFFINLSGQTNSFIPSLGNYPIPSAILSTVEAAAQGENNGGNIDITTGSLSVTNGARVSATNNAQGRAGDVTINATQSVNLIGTGFVNFKDENEQSTNGLFAEATQVNGIAGTLKITTSELRVENGATATVSSPDGQAGNLNVVAKKIISDNGALRATTGIRSDQANIFLIGDNTDSEQALNDLQSLVNQGKLRGESLPGSPLDFLLVRNGSLIEANANELASGGNIAINTRLLLALPPTRKDDNDITANAIRGTGGVVAIKARPLGVYGIEFRRNGTSLNDITATSETGSDGIVSLRLPDVDPRRGFLQLPEDLGDSSKFIQSACPVGGQRATSRFVVTGRGGLPPNPGLALSSDILLENETTTASPPENRPEQTSSTDSAYVRNVEAQGVEIGLKGEIILTANPSKLTSSYSSWQRFKGGCDEK